MEKYKRIGIVGGVSPQSTVLFYRKIIKKHFEKNKDQYYPEIVTFSVNFDRIKDYQKKSDQMQYINEFVTAINALERAGVDFAVIASNTPHRVFEEVEKRTNTKLLSIISCVADYASKHKFKKVLLLGTMHTMKEDFYKRGLKNNGVEAIVPSDADQEAINDIIFSELALGELKVESKLKLMDIIEKNPADAVILGCTELPLLLKKEDMETPIIDSTDIFAEATLNYAIV